MLIHKIKITSFVRNSKMPVSSSIIHTCIHIFVVDVNKKIPYLNFDVYQICILQEVVPTLIFNYIYSDCFTYFQKETMS